jgi:flagellar L-ring protein precursor FlgH
MVSSRIVIVLCCAAMGCGRLGEVGRAPAFSAMEGTTQHHAMYSSPLPVSGNGDRPAVAASLWSASSSSLLGDRRAARRGDIMTVVIAIDDRAEISNSTGRSREGRTRMGVPQLFGLPQRLDGDLPAGASSAEAVDASGRTSFSGEGTVRRKERLVLRLAATIVDELPNGVLRIEGQQEVRVNNEIRELIVTGFVRPSDISRQNEVTYDKIAGARVSYGGRGQISDVQQPRYGQQIADIVLPF